MKKAGKITIAAAVMVVCLLVTVITAKCSLEYEDEIASLDAQLAELNAQETGLDTSIQNLKEKLTGEEATNGEGEPGTSEEESPDLLEDGEEPVIELEGIDVQNESGESESGETAGIEEQFGTDLVNDDPTSEGDEEDEDEGSGYEDNPDIVWNVQEALTNAGFKCGVVDGIWGINTSNAIKEYQLKKGISVTGKIGDELLRYLDINADS